MYKLINNTIQNTINSVFQDRENLYIPFAPDNTDYQTFKYYLEEKDSQGNPTGITPELKDAEGNAMTAEQITTFLGTLP